MLLKRLCPLLCFLFSFHYSFAQGHFINASDPHLSYQGRVLFTGDSAMLSWTGTSVMVNFKGTELKALLKDEQGKNYVKIILDGKAMPDIHLDPIKHTYQLASGLTNTNHTLQIFKRTEWIFGKTWFYGFDPGSGVVNKSSPPSKRKIEFYGNSITCGYAVIDSSGKDRGTPEFEDGYLSYAALTARHFNAQYSCISRSGIGLMVSWFPQIMPELYGRYDPTDAASKWNFERYTPGVVVINLFQNDSWIVKQPANVQYKARFGNDTPTGPQIISAYKKFIGSLRAKYPHANIICVLGNMDITKENSPWPGYVKTALDELQDPKITSHFFAYKDTSGHPNVSEQQAMANDLISYIEKNIKW